MDIQTLLKEIKIFLFENKKTIFLTTGVVIIIVAALQLLGYFFNSQPNEADLNEFDALHTAYFEIYIEQNNLGAFTNSYLIEAFLNQDDVINEIERKSGLSIGPVINEYREANEVIITTDEDPINVSRNTSTNIMTISFGIGTEEENLKAAKAYYQWLEDSNHQFFEDKKLFYISAPETLDIDTITNQAKPFSIKTFVIRLVLAVFGGVILGIAIALAFVLFNKKIMYAFTYGWNEDDVFLNFSEDSNPKEIAHSLIQPNNGKKVILSENSLNQELLNDLKNMFQNENQVIFNSDVLNVDPLITINEFIIVIKRKETTKSWYQDQRRQLKSYRSSTIKIVQI
ncbi:hypothetical protein [Carnobacterium sp.]|uniref:hypothetical protein n=1 Tax=Carnobacterium sp. TaxID=48221 RepID=UPI00388DE56B